MKFPLIITAVDKIIFEGDVVFVTLPGSAGELTILAHHSRIITTLKKGVIKVRVEKEGGLQEYKIDGGLLESSRNRATILL